MRTYTHTNLKYVGVYILALFVCGMRRKSARRKLANGMQTSTHNHTRNTGDTAHRTITQAPQIPLLLLGAARLVVVVAVAIANGHQGV